jgi:RND family efflux transporter MFP subunit
MTHALRLLVLATVLASSACHADSIGCLIEPDRVADVGANVMGVIEKVKVERGDMVTAGQVLARLSAQVERASVSVAQARAMADAEYKQAVAANVLAQRKLARTQDLLKQNYVSGQALDQAEAEARVAEQRVAQARESQGVSKMEFQLSAAQLNQREVRSPFDGMVLERYRTEGERIEREPVVRVARVDPLRVETIVPAALFGSIQSGQLVIVKTDLLLFPSLSARVVLVDRVIDPASNSFRVRLTLPNPNNHIPAGLRCKVDFASAAVKAMPPAAGAPAATPPIAPLVPLVPLVPTTPVAPAALRGLPPGPSAAKPQAKALTGSPRAPAPTAAPPSPPPPPEPSSAQRAGIAEAARTLPGERAFASNDERNRGAVKNYLYWRRMRLGLSASMTQPAAGPNPAPLAATTVAMR